MIAPAHNAPAAQNAAAAWYMSLGILLRRYGFWELDVDRGSGSITPRLSILNPAWGDVLPSGDAAAAIFVDGARRAPPGLISRAELAGQLLLQPARLFRSAAPIYRALFPHVSFSGPGLTPIWTTPSGATVIGWWTVGGQRHLVVGLDVVEELVRYTQGDPSKVATCMDKTMWKHSGLPAALAPERSTYLYDDHVLPGYELTPWADNLGYCLASLLAIASGLPLFGSLPGGARGGILLTGDDDTAQLEKYDEQLRLINEFPITYFLLPWTNHTAETLARLPKTVELGVHVDALEQPKDYGVRCREQTAAVTALTGRHIRTVRNHGHLNDGYWGHLSAWEECGLTLDLNTRAIDGNCPTGSYLPFRVRRADGTWSMHFSLFSTFSNSMYYIQKWPPDTQIQNISAVADRIERSDPGVVVLNFHPQNISDTRDIHKAVIEIGRRPGWIALGADSFVHWLTKTSQVRLHVTSTKLLLRSVDRVENLAVIWPPAGNENKTILPSWENKTILPSWVDEIELRPPSSSTTTNF